MTLILGVYCGHDAHFCLLRDGELTHHYAADRWTRLKHSAGWRESVLETMLRDANVSWMDIDAVACGGNRWEAEEKTSDLYDHLAVANEKFFGYIQGAKSPSHIAHNASPEERMLEFEVTWRRHTVRMFQIDHHLAHAAQAYYTGPFDEALTCSFDGGGDGAFMLTAIGGGNKLRDLEYNDGNIWPNRPAPGNLWSWAIRDLYQLPGGSMDGEGKIMGHAAYGTPRPDFVATMDTLIRRGYEPSSALMINEFNRLKGQIDTADFNSQDLMDLSASLQQATENLMIGVINRRATSTGLNKITLSGGCAYNCCANGAIFQRYPKVFVSNCPNDGGLAVGAVLLVWHHVMGNPFHGVPAFNPFKGAGEGECEDPRIADQVVDDLIAGRLVAWCNGRAENGNRALGHRSILADPRNQNVKDLINSKVKKREWFRPFAPSALGHWTGYAEGGHVPPSNYMSFAIPMVGSWAKLLPGVVHVDGTCRPQVVHREGNEIYWEIINRFHQATGVPMVLNTSLNIQEPICETAKQARATFNRSLMDVLYVNGVRSARSK